MPYQLCHQGQMLTANCLSAQLPLGDTEHLGKAYARLLRPDLDLQHLIPDPIHGPKSYIAGNLGLGY